MEIITKNILVRDSLISYLSNNYKKGRKDIIFLHGWGSSKEIWIDLLNNFDDFNIFAIDLPGFGKSNKFNFDAHIDDYSKIILSFIEKLNLSEVILVGHSFGGAVSIKSSIRSEVIKKMVLISSSGIRVSSSKKKILGMVSKFFKPLFKISIFQPIRRSLYRLIGNEDYLDSGALRNIYLNVIDEDLSPLLKQVDINVQLIWADNDIETPLWMGEKMNDEIKDSKLFILNGDHFAFLKDIDTVTKIIKTFIDEN